MCKLSNFITVTISLPIDKKKLLKKVIYVFGSEKNLKQKRIINNAR